MKNEQELNSLRTKIDQIDEKIKNLINQRAELVLKVGKTKGQEKNPKFYRPEREAQILQKLTENNKGPLSNQQMIEIFRAIIGSCLNLEQQLRIAFSGSEDPNSQIAVIKNFGMQVSVLEAASIDRVFYAVELGKAHYGIVPIHMKTGFVKETLKALENTPLNICGEIILPIEQSRYIIIGNQEVKPMGKDITSLLFIKPITPKLLLRLLEPFAKHGIEVKRIIPPPDTGGKGSEYYLIDVTGHQNDDSIKKALTEFKEMSITVKVLGSYPEAQD